MLHPQLTALIHPDLQRILDQQVLFLDQLVTAIQVDAEQKVHDFRLVQMITALYYPLCFCVGYVRIKSKVEQPPTLLTNAAKRISQGDFSYRIPPMETNELGVL